MTVNFQPIYQAQQALSRGQAIPVVGPFLISPVKIAAGVIQAVASLALGLLLGAGSGLFLNLGIMADDGERRERFFHLAKKLEKASDDSYACMECGLGSALYGLVNMLSLGILGYYTETKHETVR